MMIIIMIIMIIILVVVTIYCCYCYCYCYIVVRPRSWLRSNRISIFMIDFLTTNSTWLPTVEIVSLILAVP
jgi:hypothetical protein